MSLALRLDSARTAPVRVLLTGVMALLLLLLPNTGCYTPTDAGGEGGFDLTVEGSVGGPPGSTHTTVTARLYKTKGLKGDPQLSIVYPTGDGLIPWQAWFDAQIGTPTVRDTVLTYPITVTIRTDAKPGTFATAKVEARFDGLTELDDFSVQATEPPNYTLAVSPQAVSVVAGRSSAALTVQATRIENFSGAVTLRVSGMPTGVSTSLLESPGTRNTGSIVFAALPTTVPGTYPITITGSASGLPDRTATVQLTVTPPPAIALTLAPAAAQVRRTQSTTVVATVGRTGFAGDVALAVSGTPRGVTPLILTSPVTGTEARVLLAADSTAPIGAHTLTLRATGPDSVTATATLPLTILPAPSIGVVATPTTVSVVQGQSGSLPLAISREGVSGEVTLSATGAPTGVTPTFTPNPATSTTSTLTLAVASSVAVGSYSVTVRAAAGSVSATATVTLTVTAAPPATRSVTWRFCDASRLPLWFAVRDGTSGSWTRVTPDASNTLTFTLTADVGAVAMTQRQPDGSTQVAVRYLTAVEVGREAADECALYPVPRELIGSVAGVSAGQVAQVYGGHAQSQYLWPGTPPYPAVRLTNLRPGPVDLLAVRANSETQVADRMILRRNLNPTAGSTVPVLDLSGSEAFAPATATYTFANAGTDGISTLTNFQTANGYVGGWYTAGAQLQGIPSTKTESGDLHYVMGYADQPDGSYRMVAQYNRELAARTLTFGSALPAPTVSTVRTAPYAMLRARGSWSSEYGETVTFGTTQASGGGRGMTVTASRGYLGGAPSGYDIEVPDLSGVAGFSSAWGLAAGASTRWTMDANAATATAAEGAGTKAAGRRGTITP